MRIFKGGAKPKGENKKEQLAIYVPSYKIKALGGKLEIQKYLLQFVEDSYNELNEIK